MSAGASRAAAAASSSGDVLHIEPSESFVVTPEVDSLTRRALTYVRAGLPLHFAGPPGVGKTRLAFHVAALIGSPVVLLHGDHEFGTSDLLGRDDGFRRSKVVDNFIHSVTKVSEELRSGWVDNRLTIACMHGYTLIYDEFNRSRPEANNPLLSVLAEGVLSLPRQRGKDSGYIHVHPDFRVIFTSNPEEYAGVHRAQDALLDRVITLFLSHYDRETEVAIVSARAEVAAAFAEPIVEIVRILRGHTESGARPTIRAAIAIARAVAVAGARVHVDDEVFRWACRDILSRDYARIQRNGRTVLPTIIDDVVEEVLRSRRFRNR